MYSDGQFSNEEELNNWVQVVKNLGFGIMAFA